MSDRILVRAVVIAWLRNDETPDVLNDGGLADQLLARLTAAGYPVERLPELLAMRERARLALHGALEHSHDPKLATLLRQVLGVTEGET